MNERKKVLLNVLLQDLGAVFQRADKKPENWLLELPQPFQQAVNFDARPDVCANLRLAPIAEHITLEKEQQDQQDQQKYQYRYPLKPLSVKYEDFMPIKELTENLPTREFNEKLKQDYNQLWDDFASEFNSLQHQEDFDAYFFTVYFLLKKYFSRVPSLEADDISLFDQARVRAAMKDCQYQFRQENGQAATGESEFLLIEGDISGIQNFIFHMVDPQQEQARLTKRLRGRSFYVLLLTETIVTYLLRKLRLTVVHLIWSGGGHFLILAPKTKRLKETYTQCFHELNQSLLEKFYGELACVLSMTEATLQELEFHFSDVRHRVDMGTQKGKYHKLSNVLSNRDTWTFPAKPSKSGAKIDRHVEQLNEEQEQVGNGLAKLNKRQYQERGKSQEEQTAFWLAYQLCKAPPTKKQMKEVSNYLTSIRIGNDCYNWFLSSNENPQWADAAYLINSTNFLRQLQSFHAGFTFIATHVDVYDKEHDQALIQTHNGTCDIEEEQVKAGDIKQFSHLADEGKGGFLGVLRMDVDRLGEIFDRGIMQQQQQSLARIASLSSDMAMFFTGYFQELCRTKFTRNIYIDYAGGDDLFVVGAWQTLVELSCQVRKDFKAFTCENQDLNISGAVFLCKGKYPIHRAAERAGILLDDLAKDNECKVKNLQREISIRNAFAIFNQRMEWEEFLKDLKPFGDDLIKQISTRKLPRAYLYKLLKLHHDWKYQRELNTARLFYITVRNIEHTGLQEQLLDKFRQHCYLENESFIPMLVGYVGLYTRNQEGGSQYGE